MGIPFFKKIYSKNIPSDSLFSFRKKISKKTFFENSSISKINIMSVKGAQVLTRV
jgi:hypothetical protein